MQGAIGHLFLPLRPADRAPLKPLTAFDNVETSMDVMPTAGVSADLKPLTAFDNIETSMDVMPTTGVSADQEVGQC